MHVTTRLLESRALSMELSQYQWPSLSHNQLIIGHEKTHEPKKQGYGVSGLRAPRAEALFHRENRGGDMNRRCGPFDEKHHVSRPCDLDAAIEAICSSLECSESAHNCRRERLSSSLVRGPISRAMALMLGSAQCMTCCSQSNHGGKSIVPRREIQWKR